MQKILCFFKRESAKFVPIVRVAGRAGGTTMVIKSRARTMMRCQESCFLLAIFKSWPFSEVTYTQPNEIDERCYETKQCNHSHHGNIAERIAVEFEARRLWEEH